MDFFVKGDTMVKVIIMLQEGFYTNTVTINPFLTTTLRACRHTNISGSYSHQSTPHDENLCAVRSSLQSLLVELQLCSPNDVTSC